MPLDKEGNPILFKPWVNTTKTKSKYFVYVKADNKKGYKKIGFGHKDYQHFKDKLGNYSKMDHGDKERRKRYRKRASRIKNKEGKLTYLDKNTSNYWAYNTLW